MTDHFDPLDLRPEASLNRTRLAAVPGADARWIGRPAFELLSADALATLSADVEAPDVADEFGRRLAHLLATLLLAPAAPLEFAQAGAALSPWRLAYLGYWRTIHEVWLGGGLAAALGQPLLTATRRELQRLEHAHVAVELSPHAAELPLIGAARSSRAASRSLAVLDFGHTAIKRGIAALQNGRLERLTTLPSWAAPEAQRVVETVVEAVSATVQAAQECGQVDRTVWISLASYLQNGWPADTRGLYTPLNTASRTELEAQLSARAGTSLEVRLLHDGTAAARALPRDTRHPFARPPAAKDPSVGLHNVAGDSTGGRIAAGDPRVSSEPRAAVIMLGTALGVGFCPGAADAAATPLLELAPDFAVAVARARSV